jgi:flavin-binding protein dodecin
LERPLCAKTEPSAIGAFPPCGNSEDVAFGPSAATRSTFRKSIEDAIQNAITRASKTIREMKWFEVVQTRGHIEKGAVRHYQVTLRVGFTLEE